MWTHPRVVSLSSFWMYKLDDWIWFRRINWHQFRPAKLYCSRSQIWRSYLLRNLCWSTYLSWASAETKPLPDWDAWASGVKMVLHISSSPEFRCPKHPTQMPYRRKALNGWHRHIVRWREARIRFPSRSGESIRTLHMVRVCCALIYLLSPPGPDGGRRSFILAILDGNIQFKDTLLLRRCVLE